MCWNVTEKAWRNEPENKESESISLCRKDTIMSQKVKDGYYWNWYRYCKK